METIRFDLDVPNDLYKEIESAALQSKLTLSDFIVEAVQEKADRYLET
jgi:uncharacterized protein (DUF1778 family)